MESNAVLSLQLEEVPVKWMDRPSATEMETGCASEMDRQTNGHKNENASGMENHVFPSVVENIEFVAV